MSKAGRCDTEVNAYLEGEIPHKRGHRPLCSCGTRFVAHKVAALERLVDNLGAYISHPTTLAEDPKIKSTDSQKIKGICIEVHGVSPE